MSNILNFSVDSFVCRLRGNEQFWPCVLYI